MGGWARCSLCLCCVEKQQRLEVQNASSELRHLESAVIKGVQRQEDWPQQSPLLQSYQILRIFKCFIKKWCIWGWRGVSIIRVLAALLENPNSVPRTYARWI